MNDSNVRERLDAKHGRDHEKRIEAVKRWVEYIKSESPETWGPQQNAVVDGQLDAVQGAQTSATHRKHVVDVAGDILATADDSGDGSERASPREHREKGSGSGRN